MSLFLRGSVTTSALVGLATLLALLLPLLAGTAEANGATTILYDQIQGRYRLVVGIIPARPVIPQTHMSMQVFDAGEERLLRDTDVDVSVFATGPPGSPNFGPKKVANEASIVYFEVDVPFDVVGAWQVEINVTSESGAETFLIPVQVGEPGTSIQWIWVSLVLIVILLVGIWTWMTMSRRAGAQQQ